MSWLLSQVTAPPASCLYRVSLPLLSLGFRKELTLIPVLGLPSTQTSGARILLCLNLKSKFSPLPPHKRLMYNQQASPLPASQSATVPSSREFTPDSYCCLVHISPAWQSECFIPRLGGGAESGKFTFQCNLPALDQHCLDVMFFNYTSNIWMHSFHKN